VRGVGLGSAPSGRSARSRSRSATTALCTTNPSSTWRARGLMDVPLAPTTKATTTHDHEDDHDRAVAWLLTPMGAGAGAGRFPENVKLRLPPRPSRGCPNAIATSHMVFRRALQ
jgi:hypothetical protein